MADRPKPRRDAIDAVFGEELPQASTDERDNASPHEDAERDRWLLENLPPHHL